MISGRIEVSQFAQTVASLKSLRFGIQCLLARTCQKLLLTYLSQQGKYQSSILKERNYSEESAFIKDQLKSLNPLGTGRKLTLHKIPWTSCEHFMYIQFTSCVQRNRPLFLFFIFRFQLFITLYYHRIKTSVTIIKVLPVNC